MELRGVAASGGVGVGTARKVLPPELDWSHVTPAGAEKERERLDRAAALFTQRTRALAGAARKKAGDHQAEILEGQLVMFSDPAFQRQLTERLEAGESAEAAVDGVCQGFIQLFSATGDQLMAQRSADVEDLRRRLIAVLLGREEPDLSALPAGTVLVLHELTPSMASALDLEHTAAIVAETGGLTSHAAILARAMGLPAVLSVPNALEAIPQSAQVAVDGGEGLVLSAPEEALLAAYREKQAAQAGEKAALEAFRHRPTRTADGRAVRLLSNVGSPQEAAAAAEVSGAGVGLFRTEFLFLDRPSLPSEEEQFTAYRSAAELFPQGEVILRTLDVGGDKAVPALDLPKEENPFLGLRGVRFCLRERELFAGQLRAMLRASAFGPVRVMLPMVSRLSELHAVQALLEEQKAALDRSGLSYDRDLPLGVMVETPAAVAMADALAREAAFFSIGTNDLTQYVMAADRGSPAVASIGSPFDPAVLRAVDHVISAAHAAGIPAGMCGEAAAEPLLVPVWLGLGLDEFSVSPAALLPVRRELARWDSREANALAQQALALTGEEAVRRLLEDAFKHKK